MRNTILAQLSLVISSYTLVCISYTTASTILTDADDVRGDSYGTRGGAKNRNRNNRQERRTQIIEGGVIATALEDPMGIPLPPSSTESPGAVADDEVEYSPVYNTRMKNCKGYEAEGLRGYTNLDDLRKDLQLYFYDMNGYSYHRTAAEIAAELLTESPTGNPSPSPSVSSKPSVATSEAPSFTPSKHPITAAPTDEPTSSVRLPVEPTRSPSPTMLPKFVGITSPTTLLNSTLNSTEVDLTITIPEGALGDVDSTMGQDLTGQVIFIGGDVNPADVLGEEGEGSTFAPTVLIPSLRTGSPSRTPTMKPIEMDENQLMIDEGSVRKRIRGHGNDELGGNRRRLQDAPDEIMTIATIPFRVSPEYAEVMNEEGLPELDEVVTEPNGEEILIPVKISAEDNLAGNQEKGGLHFHICPDTNFQFNSIFVAQLKYLPLVLESPVQKPLTLACLKENTCIFNGGNYHLVFNNNGLEDDSLGESSMDKQHSSITVRGINFQEAEEASNVLNDPRGKVVFEKCKWESNKGEAIVIDGKYSSTNKEREYYGVNDYMLPDGKENPFASTEPTIPASTTAVPLAFLFGSTAGPMTTDVNLIAAIDTPGTRLLEEPSTSSPKSSILVRQSTFTGNKGKATIAVDSFLENSWEDSGSADTGPIRLELEESTFSFERVQTSVIIANGATVSSTGSVFDRNTASSVIQTNAGTISITDTEFIDNDVTGGDGVVVVDSDSKVGDTNCVQGSMQSEGDGVTAMPPLNSRQRNLPADVCDGTVVMMAGDTCRPFGQVCDPNATPVSLIGDSEVFDDSEALGGNDVESDGEVLDDSELLGVINLGDNNQTLEDTSLEAENDLAMEAPIMGDLQPEVVTDCHDNWDDLKYAVENKIVDGDVVLSHIGSLYFKICPNSSLDASSGPIVIGYDYITIQCGEYGLRVDNCQILGGYAHFHVVGSSTDLKLAGLRMSASTGSSVIAAGTSDATLQISDCEWIANRGASAILILNNATATADNITGALDISSLIDSSEGGMAVEMSSVGFMQNVLTYGTVVNVAGSLSIDKGRFNQNEIRVGDIAVVKSGELFLRDSCFDESSSMAPGTIFLDQTSFLQENVNTFGFDNTDGSFGGGLSCTGVFMVANGSDCLTGSNCDGTCNDFTSKTCILDVTPLPPIRPGGSGGAAGEGTNSPNTSGTEYIRARNPAARNIVPIIVAVLVCSFIVFGLLFIIFKRRRKKPASEGAFQTEFEGDEVEDTPFRD